MTRVVSKGLTSSGPLMFGTERRIGIEKNEHAPVSGARARRSDSSLAIDWSPAWMLFRRTRGAEPSRAAGGAAGDNEVMPEALRTGLRQGAAVEMERRQLCGQSGSRGRRPTWCFANTPRSCTAAHGRGGVTAWLYDGGMQRVAQVIFAVAIVFSLAGGIIGIVGGALAVTLVSGWTVVLCGIFLVMLRRPRSI
jgi:hypothetical protein